VQPPTSRVRLYSKPTLFAFTSGTSVSTWSVSFERRAGGVRRRRARAQAQLSTEWKLHTSELDAQLTQWVRPGSVAAIGDFRAADRSRPVEVLPELELLVSDDQRRLRLRHHRGALRVELRSHAGDRAWNLVSPLESRVMEIPVVLDHQLERDEASGSIWIELETAGTPLRLEEHPPQELREDTAEGSEWAAITSSEGTDCAYRPVVAGRRAASRRNDGRVS